VVFVEKGINNVIMDDIEKLHWRHSINLGNGVITRGELTPQQHIAKLKTIQLPDLTGKSVSDIGAWDGFFSFEAKKKGAERVLAVDIVDRPTFHLANKILGWKIDFLKDNIFNLTASKVGKFDVCLFLGVLYHLDNPSQAFINISDITNEQVIVETAFVDIMPHIPMLIYPVVRAGYIGCCPNEKHIHEMMRLSGFKKTKTTSKFYNRRINAGRASFHGFKESNDDDIILMNG